ncbi:MAG: response regulator [Gammaproteobacteria bacterium]
MDSKLYYAPNEVAQLFMVSPVTVRQWANKGLLQAALTAGGHRRFLHQDLIRFAQDRGMALNWPGRGGAKILVVEDDPQQAAYVYENLQGHPGIEAVELAGNGFEAGHRLHSFRPNLMLLDLMMPGMDGYSVCRSLKADPMTHNIRVLAMTGYPNEENVQRILDAGAEACLPKPLDTARLLPLLRLEEERGTAHSYS